MNFDGGALSVTTTAVAVVAILGVALGALDEVRRRRKSVHALDVARRADREREKATDDPGALLEYLVNRIGPMSLKDFAEDADARAFVTRAADRADGFLNAAITTTASHQDHLTAAQTLIEAGEIPGGLARLRLAVEQAINALRDDDLQRPPWAALRYVTAKTLSPDVAHALEHAVHTANRALHGQHVEQTEALMACRDARHALELLKKASPAPR